MYVSFVVDKSGNVVEPKVIKGLGWGCDDEALRVIKMMPPWTPGKQNGNPVKVQFNLPVLFTTKGNTGQRPANHYQLGIAYAKGGNFSAAIEQFTLEIGIHPEHVNAYYNRGASYYRLSDFENACRDWKKTAELGDTSVNEQIRNICEAKMPLQVSAVPVHHVDSISPRELQRKALLDSVAKAFAFPKREVFFEVSLLLPRGAYADNFNVNSQDSPEESITKAMEGKGSGFGAMQGYAAEIGAYFYYNDQPRQVVGGLRLSASFTDNPFRWEKDSNYIFNNAAYKDMYSMSLKFGPCIRYILGKNFVFRAHYQMCFTANTRAAWNYDDDSPHSYFTTYNNQDYRVTYTNDHAFFNSGVGTGIKHELGLVLSWRKLLLGIDYNFGNLKYNSVRYKRSTDIVIDEYYPSTGYYQHYDTLNFGDDRKFKAKAPTGYFLFNFGMIL